MTNPSIEPAAFTVWGAMHYTGLSRTRMYNLMKAGELQSFTVGSRRMFRRVDLDALIEKLAVCTKDSGR